MMRMRPKYALFLAGALLVAGCAAPALRPVQARERVLASPQISDWYSLHSAPAILPTLGPVQARRWRKYHPDVMFDRVQEGLLVRLEAKCGPEPRAMTVLMDSRTGSILSVKAQ
jgi:hypothetical protein